MTNRIKNARILVSKIKLPSFGRCGTRNLFSTSPKKIPAITASFEKNSSKKPLSAP
jgi:hypothetical protein